MIYSIMLKNLINKIKKKDLPLILYNIDGLTITFYYNSPFADYIKLGEKWHNCLNKYPSKFSKEFLIEVEHNGFKMAITSLLPERHFDSCFEFSRYFINNLNGPANKSFLNTAWMNKDDNNEVFTKKLYASIPQIYPQLKKLAEPLIAIARQEFANQIMGLNVIMFNLPDLPPPPPIPDFLREIQGAWDIPEPEEEAEE